MAKYRRGGSCGYTWASRTSPVPPFTVMTDPSLMSFMATLRQDFLLAGEGNTMDWILAENSRSLRNSHQFRDDPTYFACVKVGEAAAIGLPAGENDR
jgi:hypothetical protein